MLRIILASLFALLLSGNVAAQGNFEAYWDSAKGKLVIPHLNVSGQIYYVTLRLTDSARLVFEADSGTLTNLTPTGGTSSAGTSNSLLGTWTEPSQGLSKARLTFNANGTYELFLAIDPGCPAGLEKGSYTWSSSTGLLLVAISSDSNGSCGFSHPTGGLHRIFSTGSSQLQLREKLTGENYSIINLTRVSS